MYQQRDTMSTKIANKKTTCNKNKVIKVAPQPVDGIQVIIPAKVTAYVVGCSEVYVRKVKSGDRADDSPTAQNIIVAELVLQEKLQRAFDETKEIFQSNKSIG